MFAWGLPIIELISIATGLAIWAICKLITGREPGEAKRVRASFSTNTY